MREKTTTAAKGKWPGILSHFGLGDFLQNRHGPCPMCGGKDRYRFDNKEDNGTWICNGCGAGDGMRLLMEFKGWDFKTAAAEIDNIIGNVQAAESKPKADPMPRIRAMTESLQPVGESVRGYLAGRGLKATKFIYSAPSIYYHEGKRQGEYDCMVCPLSSAAGEVLTYHITYLANGQKADVPCPKKLLPPSKKITGGAIRLTAIYPHIGIAEGIETALAVMQIFRIPCWSAVNASMLERFQPPKGVGRITVFGDNDKNYAGQKAAFTLANRLILEGHLSEVKLPTHAGTDFADTIQRIGRAA